MEPETPELVAERRQQLQQRLSAYRNLVKSAGWALLRKDAETQITARTGLNLAPPSSMDDMVPRIYRDGETNGMLTLLNIPELQINHTEETLKKPKYQETEDGNGNGTDTDASANGSTSGSA